MTLALYGKSRRRQGLLLFAAVMAVVLGAAAVFANPAMPGSAQSGGQPSGFGQEDQLPITWGEGFEVTGDCGPYTDGDGYVWHFVTGAGSPDFVSLTATFQGAGEVSGVITESGDSGKFNHAWVVTSTQDTLTDVSAVTDPADGHFVLSHFCDASGEPDPSSLTIVKTTDVETDQQFTFQAQDGLSPSLFDLGDGEQQLFGELEAGDYTVTEEVPGDWTLESVTCGDASTTPVTNGVQVHLGEEEDVTCTFHNVADPEPETRTLIVQKSDANDVTPSDWTLSIDNESSTTSVSAEVEVGESYAIDETGPFADFDFVSVSCDQDVTPVGEGTARTVTIPSGEADITCTYTNEPVEEEPETRTLIVEKSDANDVTPSDWTLSIDDESSTSSVSAEVEVGESYTIDESGNFDDYDFVSVGCDQGVTPAGEGTERTLTIPSGEGDITCTYENEPVEEPAGTGIIIRKSTDPSGGEGFTFSHNIDDSGDFTLDDGDSREFDELDAGTYVVTETDLPANWVFDRIECSGDDASSVSTDGAEVTIGLVSGETVDCTFYNEEEPVLAAGNLSVNKIDGDGNQIEWTVTISGGEFGAEGEEFTIPADGDLFLPGLDLDEYTIEEETREGWSIVDTTVDGVSVGAQVTVDVTVEDDATTEVVFQNEQDEPAPDPLTGEKDGSGSYQVEYDWDITKSVVGEANRTGEPGDSETYDFDLDVTRTTSYVNIEASGTVSLTNPNDSETATVASISEGIDGASIESCEVNGDSASAPYSIGPGETLTCDWSMTLADGDSAPDNIPNTVDVTMAADSAVPGPEGTIGHTVTFTGGDPIGEATQDLEDNFNETGYELVESDITGGTFGYQGTLTCSEDRDDYDADGTQTITAPNIARLQDSGVESNQVQVTLECEYPDPRTLIVEKSSANGVDPDEWTLSIDSESAEGSVSAEVEVGSSYTIDEDGNFGDYNFVGVTCDEGVSPAGSGTERTVTIPAGEGDITCTYTNEPVIDEPDVRTLVVEKSDANGIEPSDWELQIAGNDVAAMGAGSVSAQVEVGEAYTIDEAGDFDAYNFVGVTCDEGVTPEGEGTQRTVSIPEGEGDITCTYTNEPDEPVLVTGDLVVNKVDGDGNPIEWTVTISGGEFGSEGEEFTITADDELFLPGLESGVYTIEEETVDGWSVVDTTVNGASQGAQVSVNVVVGDDATAEVVFQNEEEDEPAPVQDGTLVINKVITNPDAEGASDDHAFTASIGGSQYVFTGNQAVSVTLGAGEYVVIEAADDEYMPAGWALAEDGVCPADATNSVPAGEDTITAEVEVEAGETTSLCFYNTKIVDDVAGDVTTPSPPDTGSGLAGPVQGSGTVAVLSMLAILAMSLGAAALAIGRARPVR